MLIQLLTDDYKRMTETTWAALSSLLILGMFFKFRRFWSLRNLDLLALLALAPGLLLVSPNHQHLGDERAGYIWLFCVGAFFMVRLVLDSVMVRRPLLEPNLSPDGLTFTGAAMLLFLLTNVVITPDLPSAAAIAATPSAPGLSAGHPLVPGHPLFLRLAALPDPALLADEAAHPEARHRYLLQKVVSETTAIAALLAVVLGMVLIGFRHFDNATTGVAAASLYLLLPYTAQLTGRPEHVLPAALLIWAVEAYRRPAVAGILIGLASAAYYPLYLLPLWCGFYVRRGLARFCAGVAGSLVLLVALLPITAHNWSDFFVQLKGMVWVPLAMESMQLHGFWHYHMAIYRVPVYAGFAVICGSLALWPPQKNLGTLLSCSAAVMLGVQFWRAQYGGLFMAWYLPLLLLTIFRPNLEDRVAHTAVNEGWFRKHREAR